LQKICQRRSFLKLASLALPTPLLGLSSLSPALEMQTPSKKGSEVTGIFPTQTPKLVLEMVTVSHFNLTRVTELVEAQPSLARATWDWGFGDWETALGAASHMGNRPIAEYLISKGARPSLFSSAMLGHLEVVKAFVAAQPGVERIQGPHSITLLAHARAGGAAAPPVVEYLESLGDAGVAPLLPLMENDANAIRGTYIFGDEATEQIEVSVDQAQAQWTRKGTMGRQLFHLGGRVFYPAGAPAVRIRFTADGASMWMTIDDPDLVLKARRKQS
jgi:hypothetical protein